MRLLCVAFVVLGCTADFEAQRIAYDVIMIEAFSLTTGQDSTAIAFDQLSVPDLVMAFGPPDSMNVHDRNHPIGEAWSDVFYGDCIVNFNEGGCGGTRFLHFTSDDLCIMAYGVSFAVGDGMDVLQRIVPHAFEARAMSDEDGRLYVWAPFFFRHERSLMMCDCGMSVAINPATFRIVEIKLDFW